jgi:riboflavin synthase
MYSGITCGLFDVIEVERKQDLIHYTVRLNPILLDNLMIGASVAIDGVCQTVVSITDHDVAFHAIQDTLDRTTLSEIHPGRQVSVERSLRYGDEVGGHEVAGHVIGTARVTNVTRTENNLNISLECPPEWIKYILPKGFVAVDGSSLTVDHVDQMGIFTIHLIPETIRRTNFGNKCVGDQVNIELDHKTQAIVVTVERVLSTMVF